MTMMGTTNVHWLHELASNGNEDCCHTPAFQKEICDFYGFVKEPSQL